MADFGMFIMIGCASIDSVIYIAQQLIQVLLNFPVILREIVGMQKVFNVF
jgi:hypothetical protein